jgi:hypothetical protein
MLENGQEMTSTYYFEKIVVLYEIYTQKSEVMNNHVHLLYMETSHCDRTITLLSDTNTVY